MKEVISRYRRFFFILLAVLFAMEMVLRGFTVGFAPEGGLLAVNLLAILLFSCVPATVLWLLRWLISGRAGRVIYCVAVWVMTVIYVSQLVYYDIFSTFYTTYSMFNGAQVAEFLDIIGATILRCIVPILLECLLAALLTRQGMKAKIPEGRLSQKSNDIVNLLTASKCGISSEPNRREVLLKGVAILLCTTLVCCMLAVCVCTFWPVKLENSLEAPAQYLHHVNEIKGSVTSFGLQTASTLDTWRLAFGFTPKIDAKGLAVADGTTYDQKEDQVLDGLDFAAVAAQNEEAGEEELASLSRWLGSRTPTKKNDKTGLFRGKNLILITAESFTDFAVSEKYTPTLYRLAQEGFQFTHFYNPIWGVSTLDGEYVNTQSLIPEAGVWSMKESGDNALPLTLGNQLSAEGYVTKAYHNHSIYFYQRDRSHPNLGYDFDGQDGGFSFEKTWPESDLEMIEKTVPDFLQAAEEAATRDSKGRKQDAPFHVYYLTVSGHRDYSFAGDAMAAKHEKAVADLQMSEPCKAYLAAHIELDRAMASLLSQLEAAGKLEDTVIALAGDHYPYGLTPEEISEFKGHAVDEEYEMYESAFLLWSPGMKPEKVDKVCSNMDILPTLSNLFGLEYDSRLMMGRDIFSDAPGLVVFENRDWLTDAGSRRDMLRTDEGQVKEIDAQVSKMFAASTLILEKDYYGILHLSLDK